jgi:hypothetical protein
MKLSHVIAGLGLIALGQSLFGQTNRTERLVIPGLDPESQTNVAIVVCDPFGEGQPCPVKYTNLLSNTNLFTLEQQETIRDAFAKYKNVTTNSGPLGTVLNSLYSTNYVIRAAYRTAAVEECVANFKYTNFDAHEEIRFGAGISAKYRNRSNDGYNVYFTRTGSGTILGFNEVKHDLISGVAARFWDMQAQGLNWDFRRADFSNSRLGEYKQCTNGMVLGKYFMWNVLTGNLLIEAEFKEPYNWRKHYREMQQP